MSRAAAYRILILGGYGHFGARIAAALASTAATDIIIAGRDPRRAEALAVKLNRAGGARFEGARIDAGSPQLSEAIRAQRADLVIHTAGPFQGQSYGVACACIEAGAHYVDLADGREFVAGITALDSKARDRGLLVVSGASTVPALSGAVVDHYRERFAQIDSISVGIVPGNRAPRGVSTVASVLSYCGRPLRRWENGVWRTVYGWQDLHVRRYAALGKRWLSTCDVPDLELFPRRYEVRETVAFHAGLELALMQWCLWLMSWLARWRVVRNWQPAARFLKSASDWTMVLGTDAGGMHVEIDGRDTAGKPRRVLWSLVARQNHGPEIPCVAAIVIARKLAAGALSSSGARACLDLMTLEEFSAAVKHLDIQWSVRDSGERPVP